MSNYADLLRSYAAESGEVELPAEVTVSDVVADELAISRTPTLADTLSAVNDQNDLSAQLTDLADRADAVPLDNPDAVAISAESMNREFDTIMGSLNIELKSHSFEGAMSDVDRLKGVGKDARLYATMSRKASRDVLDLSNEASPVWAFLRRDKSRLETARSTLNGLKSTLKATRLDEDGVVVKHDGIAKFLSRNNGPVTNILTGIEGDAQVLASLHDMVEKLGERAKSATAAIRAGGDPKLDLSALYAGINALSTGKGGLMGNYTIVAEEKVDGAPKLKRTNAHDLKAGAIASGIWRGWMGGAIVFGTLAALTVGTGGIAPIGYAGAAAGAAHYGNKRRDAALNKSEVYSASTSAQVQKAIDVVLGFDKYVTYKYNWEAEFAALTDLDEALKDIGAEDKRNTVMTTYGEIEDAYGTIFRLIDIAYEQAIYDIVSMAQVVKAISEKL